MCLLCVLYTMSTLDACTTQLIFHPKKRDLCVCVCVKSYKICYNYMVCLAAVTIQIDGLPTRSIFEGDSTHVCVSKDIESVRPVNFSLTQMDRSAGGTCIF